MSQFKNISSNLKVLLAGIVLSLFSSVPVFAANDYLSALEEEAGDTGAKSTRVSAQVSTPVKKAKHVGADKVIAEGLSFDEFEETLDSNYSGSNFLYTKLSRSKRKSIYKFYQNDNRISSVREEIVRLLSSG
jgi:DNA-binding NarL/FixJ family response regulator